MPSSGFQQFIPNPRGFTEVLTSDGVVEDLQRRAEQVKAVADAELARLDKPYPPLAADAAAGDKRASATIAGIKEPLEQSRRILGSAIDAASR